MIPLEIRQVTVTIDLSFKDNLSVLDHTSQNNTSSFNSANFGAKSDKFFLPASCFFMCFSYLFGLSKAPTTL